MNLNSKPFLSKKVFISMIFIMLLSAGQLHSEIVFKKDGALVEGRITADSATSITIVKQDGKRETILRSKIIRVLFTKIYLGKVYIRMTNGTTIEGYVVDEDNDYYFVRKILTNPDETKVLRSKVMFIARSNPTDLVGIAEKTKIRLTWSPPYIPGKKYKVYARGPKDNTFSVIDETSGEKCSISGLRSNTKYNIYVTSIDGNGIESLPSDKIELLTLNNPPSKPASIKKQITDGSKSGLSTILLEWEPSIDADGEIKEYRIFSRPSHGSFKPAGTSKNNSFVLKDIERKKIKQLAIRSVDNIGDISDESYVFPNPFTVSLKPRVAYPLGKMADLFGYGYGASAGVYSSDFIFDDTLIGIDAGYLRFTGKNDYVDSINMFLPTIYIGYRYYLTDKFSLSATIGGGYTYMSTKYTDAAFEKAAKSAWEPIFTGSLAGNYSLNEKVLLSVGLEYFSIYETGGMKSFAAVNFGIDYRLF